MFKQYFHKDDLIKIRDACAEAEKTTSGELRVSILRKRTRKQKKLSVRELAVREFNELHMDQTRDKTGILIFILLKDRQFQILADEGINEKVAPDTWQEQANILIDYFKNEKYTEGIIALIRNMGKILTEHFPVKTDDTNELSDEVILK
jgi:uncharacterized membrane protein